MLFRGKHVVVLAEKLTHKQVNMGKTLMKNGKSSIHKWVSNGFDGEVHCQVRLLEGLHR